jgi:hypothetical protein
MSDEKSAPSFETGDREKGPLHHVSSRSVDVETAEMAPFEDAKFDKKLLLKKDLVLVPLLGVMYMIMVSAEYIRCYCFLQGLFSLTFLLLVLGSNKHCQCENCRPPRRSQLAQQRVQCRALDLLHSLCIGRGS